MKTCGLLMNSDGFPMNSCGSPLKSYGFSMKSEGFLVKYDLLVLQFKGIFSEIQIDLENLYIIKSICNESFSAN